MKAGKMIENDGWKKYSTIDMDDDCHKNGKESARPWLWAKMSMEYAIPGFV